MVLCAVALLATGCGPGGGQRDPGAFEAALDMVPNTEDTRGGTKLVSLDRAREALPATTERGLPPFTDITLRLAQAGIDPGERLWGLETAPGTPIGANLTAAGVDFARVDVVVDAGSDDGFILAVGSFEPGAITQSVASSSLRPTSGSISFISTKSAAA